jgi:hypothetical protein
MKKLDNTLNVMTLTALNNHMSNESHSFNRSVKLGDGSQLTLAPEATHCHYDDKKSLKASFQIYYSHILTDGYELTGYLDNTELRSENKLADIDVDIKHSKVESRFIFDISTHLDKALNSYIGISNNGLILHSGKKPKLAFQSYHPNKDITVDTIAMVEESVRSTDEEVSHLISVQGGYISDYYTRIRNRHIKALYAKDIPSSLLADKFGISRRSIQRITL